MAVPFRKVSKTRRDMRRTHYKINANGLVKCPNCGDDSCTWKASVEENIPYKD